MKRLPSELIFFVTSRCNLRCKHCFNWQNLQRNKDLSLDEIESLAKSLPGLKTLMLSGGEPFLRKDLVEICRLFVRHCSINVIDIPTSGSLGDATVQCVEELLRIEPQFRLVIGVSIDGMEKYHDANRGVPGTFARAIECCDRLLEMKKKSPRLTVDILTTLVGDNREELLTVKNFAATRLPTIDHIHWGVARGDFKVKGSKTVTLEDLALIDSEYLEYNDRGSTPSRRVIHDRFYEMRREAFLHNIQPVPCVAGRTIAVVYDDGSVAPCELLPPVGNIRDLPFGAIWSSEKMREARKHIASKKCACTHECFLQPSYASYVMKRPHVLVSMVGVGGLVRLIADKIGSAGMASREPEPGSRARRKS